MNDGARNALDAYLDKIADERKKIATQVRNNCTLPWPLPVGTDPTIRAVADWIENPPEWVTSSAETSVEADIRASLDGDTPWDREHAQPEGRES